MTVKEFVQKVAAALGKSATKIFEAIMNADLISLAKLGILVGVSIATVILIFKYLKMKKKIYTDDSKKTTVDRALEVNYADVRNQKKLHPLMKKVNKNLKKDLKPRVKKNSSKKKKYRDHDRDRYTVSLNEIMPSSEDYDLFKDLELFRQEMADKQKRRQENRRKGFIPYDDRSLKRVWENC